jgi:hypothetical protein
MKRTRTKHSCADYLWDADPPRRFGYARCSCGIWYRRGGVEFWSVLLNSFHPHRAGGRFCYWYRASGPGVQP